MLKSMQKNSLRKELRLAWLKMEVARLNGETFNAWELLNAAKSYLASIKNLANDWYSLEYSDGTHLMVDTAYIEENSSIKHQGFALSKFKAAEVAYPGIEKMTARDINGRFHFRLRLLSDKRLFGNHLPMVVTISRLIT